MQNASNQVSALPDPPLSNRFLIRRRPYSLSCNPKWINSARKWHRVNVPKITDLLLSRQIAIRASSLSLSQNPLGWNQSSSSKITIQFMVSVREMIWPMARERCLRSCCSIDQCSRSDWLIVLRAMSRFSPLLNSMCDWWLCTHHRLWKMSTCLFPFLFLSQTNRYNNKRSHWFQARFLRGTSLCF